MLCTSKQYVLASTIYSEYFFFFIFCVPPNTFWFSFYLPNLCCRDQNMACLVIILFFLIFLEGFFFFIYFLIVHEGLKKIWYDDKYVILIFQIQITISPQCSTKISGLRYIFWKYCKITYQPQLTLSRRSLYSLS